MGEEIIDGLVKAIVLQAVKDWQKATLWLKKRPDSKPAQALKQDCETFFCSEWFKFLTDANGRYILKKLREEL